MGIGDGDGWGSTRTLERSSSDGPVCHSLAKQALSSKQVELIRSFKASLPLTLATTRLIASSSLGFFHPISFCIRILIVAQLNDFSHSSGNRAVRAPQNVMEQMSSDNGPG